MLEPIQEIHDLLMTSEAARELEISTSAVIQWEKCGKLPAIKTTSGTRLFRRGDVERLKRQREAK